MTEDNFSHAINIYNAIKSGKDVTTDLSQLYFAIAILGDEVMRLHGDISSENTKKIVKKRKLTTP